MGNWTRHFIRNTFRVIIPIIVVALAGFAGYFITKNSEPEPPVRAAAAAPVEQATEVSMEVTEEPEAAVEAEEVENVAVPDPAQLISDEAVTVQLADPPGDDLDDLLLIMDSTDKANFDINLEHIAEFYGLKLREADVSAGPLTADMFFDSNDAPLKLIGVTASALAKLTPDSLQLLLTHVETEGVPLLVYEVSPESNPVVMARLTNGAIVGATTPQDCCTDWTIADTAPELTQEFTGQTVLLSSSQQQIDYELVMSPVAPEDQPAILITSTEDAGDTYPIFASVKRGSGTIYVNAGGKGQNLDEITFHEMYYGEPFRGSNQFATIVPLMFVLRNAVGDEAWHGLADYANLTLDDPPLISVTQLLDYDDLLIEMEAHNFHTGLAFMPFNYARSENEVVELFHQYPNRYSIVQHGNNNDGYEFYYYEDFEGALHPPRPLYEQEEDIREGLTRMVMHEELTGIPFGRIMIFPEGIAPEDTMTVLKEYNFLATVNRQDRPLGTEPPPDWDYNMRPANMDYESFPVISRHSVSELGSDPTNIATYLRDAVFDLFLGKPALFYSHAYEGELFQTGMDAFDPLADAVNGLTGDVQWASLNDIVLHLYLQKRNDDGSVSVTMYANQMELTNASNEPVTYHISKVETLNVPIRRFLVNGQDTVYSVENDTFQTDFIVPPDTTVRLAIIYGYGDS
jgi:hypothetical protein